eukprot:g1035.t1
MAPSNAEIGGSGQASIADLDFEFAFPFDGAQISAGPSTFLKMFFNVEEHKSIPPNSTCCIKCWIQTSAERDTVFDGCVPFPFGGKDLLATAKQIEFRVKQTIAETPASSAQRALVVDTSKLLEVNKHRYKHLIHNWQGASHAGLLPFSEQHHFAANREYLDAQPGVLQYNLLAHLAGQLTDSTIVDLGTHFGLSAFVLASSDVSNTVLSYDVDDREAVIANYNNLTRQQLRDAAPNVRFRQRNALLDLDVLRTSPLISLDTAHFPDSVPFERELVMALEGIGYRGVVVCDDIYMNAEMARWWASIKVRKFDATAVGHGKSGTGIIDFGGALRVV